MRPIPQKLRNRISEDPYYETCSRSEDGDCDGRITIEHAIIYAGRQLNELWALIPLCTWHHAVNEHQDGGSLDKSKNEWIALCRASDEELMAISKVVDYKQKRDYLNTIYAEDNCNSK